MHVLHRGAGVAALILMLGFWSATAASELSGDESGIVAVKTAIAGGVWLLTALLIVTGGTGRKLSGAVRAGPAALKLKRMRVMAALGLLVLIPSALVLAAKARAGQFDLVFGVVQAFELAAGAVNITLAGLNARDGLRLASARRRRLALVRP